MRPLRPIVSDFIDAKATALAFRCHFGAGTILHSLRWAESTINSARSVARKMQRGDIGPGL